MVKTFSRLDPEYVTLEIYTKAQELTDIVGFLKAFKCFQYSVGNTDVTAERYATYLLMNNLILNGVEFINSIDNDNYLSLIFLNRQLNEILDDLRIILYESKIDSSSVDRAKLKMNLEKYAGYILYSEWSHYNNVLDEVIKQGEEDQKDCLQALVKYYRTLINDLGLSEFQKHLSNNRRINSFKRFINPTDSLSKSMGKFNGPYGSLLFKKESMIIHGNYNSLKIIDDECIGGDKQMDYSDGTITNQTELFKEAHMYISRIYLRLWPEIVERNELDS